MCRELHAYTCTRTREAEGLNEQAEQKEEKRENEEGPGPTERRRQWLHGALRGEETVSQSIVLTIDMTKKREEGAIIQCPDRETICPHTPTTASVRFASHLLVFCTSYFLSLFPTGNEPRRLKQNEDQGNTFRSSQEGKEDLLPSACFFLSYLSLSSSLCGHVYFDTCLETFLSPLWSTSRERERERERNELLRAVLSLGV